MLRPQQLDIPGSARWNNEINKDSDYLKAKPGYRKFSFATDVLRIFCPIILLIIGIVDTTQTFGHLVKGNHHITGKPLFLFFGHEVYNPVLFFFGISKFIFKKKIRPLYLKAIFKFAIWCLVSLAIAIGWTWIHELLAKYVWNIHGTARFATKKDLKKNGLLKKSGVVIGQVNNAVVDANKKKDGSISLTLRRQSDLICHPGKLNTLLLAPTGSAKGVGVLIPTMLSFRNSMVIFDPKSENFNITAGYRSTFSRILKFAPCSYNTLRFNPVMAIRDGDEYAFRDANLIADIIFAPAKVGGGMSESEAYFSNAAKDLVTTTLLHIRFSDHEDKSLAGCLKYLTHTDFATLKNSQGESNNEQGKEQCLSMIEAKHYFIITPAMYNNRKEYYDKLGKNVGDKIEAESVHNLIVEGATRSLNRNSKEKSSVFSTVFTKLQLFDDPVLANATSGCDFEIEDFINCDEPITLYLCVPYSDIARIAPVFRILISFMLKKFSEGETQFGEVKLKHNVLFCLDEFPVLGAFPDIAENMGVLRGYGVFFIIVAQALNQLVDRYGQNHPFLDHCPIHVVYAPGSIQDAKMYSDSIGQESVHQEKISRSGQRLSNLGSLQFSDNDMGRNLLDPADIKRLPGDKSLIMVHGMQPYIAEKVVYYQDTRFKDKLQYKAPQTMEQLFQEVAGLPSRIRIKEEIEKRKAEWANIIYIDESANPDFDFENGEYKEPEGIFDEPLDDYIVQTLAQNRQTKMQQELIYKASQVEEKIPDDIEESNIESETISEEKTVEESVSTEQSVTESKESDNSFMDDEDKPDFDSF